MVAVIALTFNSLSILDPVLNTWCAIFKQYFMKFWDKGFTLETKHFRCLYISDKIKFPMGIHIQFYHLKHWLLSLYGVRHLHYSVTLSSRGWNPFPGVCSDLDLRTKDWQTLAGSLAPGQLKPFQASSLPVSFQILAGPCQLLSAHILTQASFLLNACMFKVRHILALALILIWHSP